MAEEERVYTIPLNVNGPRTKNAEYALREIRKFISRYMKSDNIWIDMHVNEYIWARGMKHIPRSIKVKAIKFEDGLVEISLPEKPEEKAEKEESKESEKAEEKK